MDNSVKKTSKDPFKSETFRLQTFSVLAQELPCSRKYGFITKSDRGTEIYFGRKWPVSKMNENGKLPALRVIKRNIRLKDKSSY